ncbi:MAG: hypothetical protein GW786_01265 [Gallionella sp.]|nr:hypothetical protein [Gallionella sp.]
MREKFSLARTSFFPAGFFSPVSFLHIDSDIRLCQIARHVTLCPKINRAVHVAVVAAFRRQRAGGIARHAVAKRQLP